MRIRKSVVAVLSVLFLAALLLNAGGLFNRLDAQKTGAQTLETKNQSEKPVIDHTADTQKANRVARLKNEFKAAVKDKKADWILTKDRNGHYGISNLTWELDERRVKVVAYDYESVEEASKSFNISKNPVSTPSGAPKTPQAGFGDESYLTSFPYETTGKMNLTFRSGNYLISLTGMKDDIFSFGKVISDTIKEKK